MRALQAIRHAGDFVALPSSMAPGKGFANRLIRVLQHDIAQRGQTPFLHVFDHNRVAIALYERLGFAIRQSFYLTKVTRLEA